MKEIGEFFKKSFEGAESVPSPQLWEKISNAPELKKYNKTRLLKRSIRYGITVISVVAVVATVAYWAMKKHEIALSPQKELKITMTDTLQKEQITPKSTVVVENTPSSEKSPQTEPIANTIPTETTAHSSSRISAASSMPTEDIVLAKNATPEIVREPEEPEQVEKTKTEKIPIAPVRNMTNNQPVNNITLPKIATQERSMPEENIESEPNPETPSATHTIAHIPSAFTPNSDGNNDLFNVYFTTAITDYEISIFDRFGQLVYHSRQVEPGWDGMLKGSPVPEGSYVYIITFTNPENKRFTEKGTLLLIR